LDKTLESASTEGENHISLWRHSQVKKTENARHVFALHSFLLLRDFAMFIFEQSDDRKASFVGKLIS
jgi:hypothetical protein